MGVGRQIFELTRDGSVVLRGASARDIMNKCPCGIYNFNAYVGRLPFKGFGSLDRTGLAQFTSGLHVACEARSSINS